MGRKDTTCQPADPAQAQGDGAKPHSRTEYYPSIIVPTQQSIERRRAVRARCARQDKSLASPARFEAALRGTIHQLLCGLQYEIMLRSSMERMTEDAFWWMVDEALWARYGM